MDKHSPWLLRISIFCSSVRRTTSESLTSAVSSALGTAVGVGNLVAIATLIERLMSQRADKARAGALLLLKTLALFALAGFVVSRPWASGSGFIAGFTAVVFGIAAGGLWGADPPPADAADKKD